MHFAAVPGSILPVKLAVISDYGSYSKAVIPKNRRPPARLGHTVCLEISPLFDSLFISPEGKRQDLFRVACRSTAMHTI